MNEKIKALKILDIAIDGDTQQRERINDDIVEEYAEAMRCGAKFPLVMTFFDGAQYWLADGFHRYHAYRSAEILDILVAVRDGTKRDARLYSASANGTHGMRLTNADKRKSVLVLLKDKEWSQWSDNQIAKHCHVTQPFVGKIRKELVSVAVTVTSNKKTANKNNELDSGVITVITPSVSNVNQQHTNHNPPTDYDPRETELDEAHSTIVALAEENERLKDAIAVGNLPEPERSAGEIIADLRAQIKTLEATNVALTAMRDRLQNENAEMKKQLAAQRKEIARLKKC